jgi:hypothetical protein
MINYACLPKVGAKHPSISVNSADQHPQFFIFIPHSAIWIPYLPQAGASGMANFFVDAPRLSKNREVSLI